MGFGRIILICLLLAVGGGRLGAGDIMYVNPGPKAIQTAIDAADDGDTIVVGVGTYYENINFRGKGIILTSADPNDPNSVASTVISGSLYGDPNRASVVTFNSGEGNDSELRGFTICGGSGTWLVISWHLHEPYWNRCGGGVVCYNMSEPTISKNVFRDNIAGQGGGVYVYGDPVDFFYPRNPAVHVKPIILSNTFINNSAVINHGFAPPDGNYPAADHGDGGAIVGFQGCDAVIVGNVIRNNHADKYGGGIHLRQWSNGQIGQNQIIGNDSTLGAGIHITYNSSPDILDNLIEANVTPGDAAAVYVYFYSNPLVERNIITLNDGKFTAGIGAYWSSIPLIRNNLIYKNYGLGIYYTGAAAPVITNNTISENFSDSAPKGGLSGGIRCWGTGVGVIENNIIASNQGGQGIRVNINGTLPIVRYNDVWGNGEGNYGGDLPDQTGINGNISVEPNFAASDANDYHLSYASLCINAGDPAFVGLGLGDIDSEPRRMGLYVDLGADEFVPRPWADITGDGIVDYLDLHILAQKWLRTGDQAGDLNYDRTVDGRDFALLAADWLEEADGNEP